MEFNEILNNLDKLYSLHQYDEAYSYLLNQINNAMNNNDDILLLGLLNELIGYYRVTSQFEAGHKIINNMIKILHNNKLENTINGATSYLNIATFYRVEGHYEESLKYYRLTEEIYFVYLDESDERYCAFYNNLSLLYQEMGENHKALQYELKALSLIKNIKNSEIEQAITYANLSQMYFLNNDKDKAKECINKSLKLFEDNDIEDPHYYAALSSLAHYYFLENDIELSINTYDKAIHGIEKNYGKSKEYYTLLKNKENVMNHSLKQNELCKQYFYTYKDELLNDFKDYEKYMAFGIIGEGSDCLGYDDEISNDHDCGPRFCIWLPHDIYLLIGKDLQMKYNDLPDEFRGVKRNITPQGQNRSGVFDIDEFFLRYLHKYPINNNDWLSLDDQNLLVCTNGIIFEDYLGRVTQIRNDLKYYPEYVRRIKLADSVAKMSQAGQVNFARSKKRKDEVTASICLYTFIEEVITTIHLLNKRYKPYYKWSYRSLRDCQILNDVYGLIEQLVILPNYVWENVSVDVNYNDQKIVIIEKICNKIRFELKRQGLSHLDDDFLLHHVNEIVGDINDR
jgi:tetratricopeptide (TPR) repeat protein